MNIFKQKDRNAHAVNYLDAEKHTDYLSFKHYLNGPLYPHQTLKDKNLKYLKNDAFCTLHTSINTSITSYVHVIQNQTSSCCINVREWRSLTYGWVERGGERKEMMLR